VDIVNIVGSDAGNRDRREARKIVEKTADRFRNQQSVSATVLEGDDVVETVVARSESYDLTIVGATRKGLLQQFVLGAIPEQIGWSANGTVIMAKRNLGIVSRLERWL
jgi:nucleotide-binding universal stress UspA family protein